MLTLIPNLYKSTSPPNTKKSKKPLTTHTTNVFTQNICTAELPLTEGSWVTISVFRGSKYKHTHSRSTAGLRNRGSDDP